MLTCGNCGESIHGEHLSEVAAVYCPQCGSRIPVPEAHEPGRSGNARTSTVHSLGEALHKAAAGKIRNDDEDRDEIELEPDHDEELLLFDYYSDGD